MNKQEIVNSIKELELEIELVRDELVRLTISNNVDEQAKTAHIFFKLKKELTALQKDLVAR